MTYPYYCSHCNITFDVKKPMSDASRLERCECGREGRRVYSGLPFLFGWRLSESSNHRFGPRDEYERNI